MRIEQLSPAQAMPNLRSASPALTMLGRLGYAARGVVHIVLGALAAQVAMGGGGQATDSRGALDAIHKTSFGTAALTLVAIGLFGYMTWRLVAAATDAEGEGNEPASIGKRVWAAARGLAYGALGLQAVKLLQARGDSGANTREDWTAWLLGVPFGKFLVGALALGIIAYAGYQLYRATSVEKVTKHLDLSKAGPTQNTWIGRLGRFGIAARAVVFALIGVFLLRAARQSDAGEAGGVAESLRAVASTSHGNLLLGVVAFGLVAYGIYQIATARYRRMRAVG